MNQPKSRIAVIVILWLAGCAELSTAHPAPTAPTAASAGPPTRSARVTLTYTSEPPPTTLVTTPTVHPAAVQQITSEKVVDWWWSGDSRVLYYVAPTGGWSYRLADGLLLKVDQPGPRTPPADLMNQLPGNAIHLGISPGRQTAIYLTLLPGLGLSPTPADGEV